MPGIVGLCRPASSAESLRGELAGMVRALSGVHGHTARLDHPEQGVALGWCGLKHHAHASQVAMAGKSAIVVDGELYGREPSSTSGPPSVGTAARLLEGYLRDGADYFARIEGRFAAAIWDADRRQLALVSDKFGTKPLYIRREEERIAFASEIKSLLTLPWAPCGMDREGLVQFFAFGHLWNRNTFYESIECADAASLLVFDQETAQLRSVRYWRPHVQRTLDPAAALENLDREFHVAVQERTTERDHLGLALSGGLDARTILAVMKDPAASTTAVSLGMEGSLDQISAAQLAGLAGCRFERHVLGKGFLDEFQRHFADMVSLTDGHYLSQCIVMPTLPLYGRLGICSLLRGHAGELVHMHKAYNFSVDRSLETVCDEQQLGDWLLPRLQSHLTDGVDGPLLRGVDALQFADVTRETLQTALHQAAPGEHPLDRVSQLFLDQRTRRETAMSLAKFNSVVDVRLPYLDGRFVEAVFATPPEVRLGEEVQTYILRKRRPEFLRPANSNTGAPVGAGPLYKQFCYYRMKILARLGVKGYQPYERLGLWLRRELRPTVESILLDPRCLDRGILEPDTVRKVVARHMNDERNHTFLLMAMMIVESGLRNSETGEAADHDGNPARNGKLAAAGFHASNQ